MTGRLFREFSMVISGSVLISAFAALTFTPMLATKMLKQRERKNAFYRATEPFFDGMNRLYDKSLAYVLRHRIWVIPVMVLMIVLAIFLWGKIPDSVESVEAFADKVLYEARVFVTPGFIFGSNGERYIRISLCATKEKMNEALIRIKNTKI